MRRVGVGAGVLLVGLLIAVLLTDSGDNEGRRAPLTPTSTRADLSGIVLRGVEGTTTTTVPQNVGKVVFRGTVRTPDGSFVPGATVRAEWWRADPPVVVEVVANDQGQWELKDVAGGRWKIRAYRTPDFATGKVEQLFVDKDTERQVDLEVQSVDDLSVTFDVEPDPPITDLNTQLVVEFAERTVDLEGRTVTTPLAGMAVTLVADSSWLRVSGQPTETTDAAGRVSWVLKCRQDGARGLAVNSALGTKNLDVAPCIPISATSTTSTAPPAPAPPPPSESTTTTRPAGGGGGGDRIEG